MNGHRTRHLAIAAGVAAAALIVPIAAADARIDPGLPTTVAVQPVSSAATYEMAYNPERDEYLAVWRPRTDPADEIFVARLDSEGNRLSGPTVIAETGADAASRFQSQGFWNPNVAYDSASNQYLVVLQRGESILALGEDARTAVITGQLVSDLGVPVGGEVALNPSFGTMFACAPRYPDVAANPAGGGFTLTYNLWWQTTTTKPTWACEGATAAKSTTMVQQLSSSLTLGARVKTGPVYTATQISQVAYHPTNGNVFVASSSGEAIADGFIYDASLNKVAEVDIEHEPAVASSGNPDWAQPIGDPATGDWVVVSTTRFFELAYTNVFSPTGEARRGSALATGVKPVDVDAVGDGTVVIVGTDAAVAQLDRDGSTLSADPGLGGNQLSQRHAVAANGVAADPSAVTLGASADRMSVEALGFDLIPPAVRPLVPGRLLDTRDTGETVDGLFAGGGKPAAGSTTVVKIAGRGGVADDADAAVLNITAVKPDRRGFVTVYACDEERPGASNLNYERANIANSVVAAIAADGTVCLYSRSSAHLLIDVNGFVPSGGSIEPVVPARLLETRDGPDFETDDGVGLGGGRVGAGSVTRVKVAGRGGVPSDASAALLNITSVNGLGNGFLTVYSCDADQPAASNLNAPAGGNIANLVLSEISSSGEVCIYANASTHLLADVNAYVPASSSIVPLTPARLHDGRPTAETVDGIAQRLGRVAAGSTTTIRVRGRGGVPQNATGAVLNVTSVRGDNTGFYTVYPCDEQRPDSSNLNYITGQVVANFVSVKLSASGTACVYTKSRTDLVVDVNGWSG